MFDIHLNPWIILIKLNIVFTSLNIISEYHSVNHTAKNLDAWMFTNSTQIFLNFAYHNEILQQFDTDFEIIFKCMSGATTENGKFIMPLEEKLSYGDSSDRCDGWGFAIGFLVIKSCIRDKNALTLQKTVHLIIFWTFLT